MQLAEAMISLAEFPEAKNGEIPFEVEQAIMDAKRKREHVITPQPVDIIDTCVKKTVYAALYA